MDLYLDCNATTPLAPEVLEAMQPFWIERMGNPSSRHRYGRIAKDAVERARGEVAALLNVSAGQIVFTGSGTESNHLAIHGVAESFSSNKLSGKRIAIGSTEHASILSAANSIGQSGWDVVQLEVDHNGLFGDCALEQIRLGRPSIISVMLANNETGVIQNIAPLVDQAHRIGAVVHVDASQAAGKIPLDFPSLNVDCLTISAHKMYGPKGVAALVLAPSLELMPIIDGGGQERGLRSGTENVPAIVGFGAAARLSLDSLQDSAVKLLDTRRYLEAGIKKIGGIDIVAETVNRLPNTVMMIVSAIEGETMLMQLDQRGFFLSSGSACQAGKTGPSHVLTAMGVSGQRARNAVRVSLCRGVTREKIDLFLDALSEIVEPRSSAVSMASWG